MIRKKTATRKLAIVVSLLMMMTFSEATVSTVFAADTDISVAATVRGAGGYVQGTYSAPATNRVLTLVPTSYASRAQLTVEVKSKSSGISSIWMEVTSNQTGGRIWSGFIDAVSGMKATAWFNMRSGDTYTVRTHVTGSGTATVAASLWS